MSAKHRFTLSLTSGFLLCLPWYNASAGMLLFVAFVPLLFIEDSLRTTSPDGSARNFFLYASLAFLTWNAGTTWWIARASLAGVCTAILVNTFLFSAVFGLYHYTRKKGGDIVGNIAFISYWLAFEYFYLNAEISWPWLNLGNAFANNPNLIQWYEYTGALGGTLWVLAMNLVVFTIVKKLLQHISVTIYLVFAILFIVLPVIFSMKLYHGEQENGTPCNIAVIQPAQDPYNYSVTPGQECKNLVNLASSVAHKQVDYFVAPEVSVHEEIWEHQPERSYTVQALTCFMSRYPEAHFIFGTYTYRKYPSDTPYPVTAQKMKNENAFFGAFNSALQLDTGRQIGYYHKSKLVVGIEKLPYPQVLGFLTRPIVHFGGSVNSYGTQGTRSVFVSGHKPFRIAPVICYESVYGEFVTGYVKNGANLIFIMTNDGWWGNTPGHRQHLDYARLRAIETRRCIARAASTGISALIDQRGEIIDSLGWGRRGVISGSIRTNDRQTFYVKHGDYLGRLAYFVSAGVWLVLLFKWIFGRKRSFARL
jgi:apolipoprotein N-acyltransferase